MSPYGFQKARMAIAVLTGELKDVKSTDGNSRRVQFHFDGKTQLFIFYYI